MTKDIQFVTDVDGTRTGAIVPIEEYEEQLASYEEADLISHQPDISRQELTAFLQCALATALELPNSDSERSQLNSQ